MLLRVLGYSGFALTTVLALLFLFGHRLRRGHWMLSICLSAATSGFVFWLQLHLTGSAPPIQPTLTAVLVIAAIVTAVFPDWNSIGHVAYTAVLGTTGAFLAFAAFVLATARLGPWSLAFGCLLFILQVGSLVLLVANMFEVIDVVCRLRWRRVATPSPHQEYCPKVSLHVPIHAEPPELVIETLNALSRLDYASLEVLVVDNNTPEESLWRPVEMHCRRLGSRFRFFHLNPWPGYKSGALNFALAETAPDAEIVGIVDADYVVEPTFLADLVGFFANGQVAFVQTPQDYRDQLSRGRYGKALYWAYLYFFKISMATRNEYNAIIYAGTMGLIRRSALEQVGGWNEWCITEDAELSLRLLDSGWESVYVDRTYGRGLMPLDYAGLKKQRFRWAFGGMQILRLHAARLFNPFHKGKLTLGQRFAYINGGLQWLNDVMALAFTAILLIGTGALLFGGSFSSIPLVGAAVLMPPLFVLFAVSRFIWAFRVRTGCRTREAADALTVLVGLTWVVALACVKGLISRRGVFLRTPKQAEIPTLWNSLRIVLIELFLGAVCVAAALALVLSRRRAGAFSAWGVTVILLVWQAYTYLAAVQTSAWSHGEARPASVRNRRFVFHNIGPRHARFVTESRAALAVVAVLLAAVGLLYLGIRHAPMDERIQRADPLHQFVPSRSVMRPSPAELAGATLIREADAARHRDVAAALSLWDPNGTVIDRNFTPKNDTDDVLWSGPNGLRARYVREFSSRKYESLWHRNLQIVVDGQQATIENDLDAVMEQNAKTYRVHLPKSDRWILRPYDDDWKVVTLEVNRADVAERPPPAMSPARVPEH